MTNEEVIASQRATIDDLQGQLKLAAALYHPTIDRQAKQIEQQAKEIKALREALNWEGLRVSNAELEQALKYLGPTGNRAEAQIKAAVEHLIYMRVKAQAALQEES